MIKWYMVEGWMDECSARLTMEIPHAMDFPFIRINNASLYFLCILALVHVWVAVHRKLDFRHIVIMALV
jgi:hypothetical protein